MEKSGLDILYIGQTSEDRDSWYERATNFSIKDESSSFLKKFSKKILSTMPPHLFCRIYNMLVRTQKLYEILGNQDMFYGNNRSCIRVVARLS